MFVPCNKSNNNPGSAYNVKRICINTSAFFHYQHYLNSYEQLIYNNKWNNHIIKKQVVLVIARSWWLRLARLPEALPARCLLRHAVYPLIPVVYARKSADNDCGISGLNGLRVLIHKLIPATPLLALHFF